MMHVLIFPVDKDGKSVIVTNVECVDGDVELGQRKSK